MQNKKNTCFRRAGLWLVTASVIAFTGCSSVKSGIHKVDDIDPAMNLGRDDYRHMSSPKSDGSTAPEPLEVTIDKAPPPVPQLAEILAAPRPPKIGETKLVSISVTDDVPLKDVLLELAKLADVDIELDSGISGGVSFIAKEKPFNEVIDRIAGLAGLRYTMKDGVLRVERDTPYIKSYAVDFLNLDRDSDNSVTLATNVLSSGGGSSGAVSTGATASMKTKTKGDFWESLQLGLDQIVAYAPAKRSSSSTLQADDANTLTNNAAPAAAPVVAAPAAAGGGAAGGAAAANGSNAKKEYTINRQAGIVTLNGTSKQQELTELLLNKLKTNSSSQVLIEAKILEVDLNDQYKTGINWSALGKNIGGGINFNAVGSAISTTPTTAASIGVSKGDFTGLLSAVDTFGVVRTLSSPRLHAINNQPSTLTFATNKVYFDVKATQSAQTTTGSTTNAPQVTVTSDIKTVPVGIIMSIMPSIDMENNEVTLSVHPTLSTLSGAGVSDPAVKYLAAQVGDSSIVSVVPEVQVRDLDSTVRMKSGQTMVIGGLMQQGVESTDTGVPFAGEVPILGNLLKGVSRTTTNKELVLLIRATIVDTNGSLNKVDKKLFNKFTDDPRPVSF